MTELTNQEVSVCVEVIKDMYMKKGALLRQLKKLTSKQGFSNKLISMGIDEVSARIMINFAEHPEKFSSNSVLELAARDMEQHFRLKDTQSGVNNG